MVAYLSSARAAVPIAVARADHKRGVAAEQLVEGLVAIRQRGIGGDELVARDALVVVVVGNGLDDSDSAMVSACMAA